MILLERGVVVKKYVDGCQENKVNLPWFQNMKKIWGFLELLVYLKPVSVLLCTKIRALSG